MVDYSLYNNEEDMPTTEGLVLKRARARMGMLTDNVTPGEAVLPSSIQRYRNRAAELYKQGSDLYGQEPDMSQFEDFARQRSEGGNAAMLNALAAQFAGEGFSPVQAQFLKKAAAAQEPMKLGSGVLTAEGKYLKDPIATQDKRGEFLLQQARAFETLAQGAETAQERANAARLAQEARDQHQQMMASIAQQNADTNARRREDAQSNAAVMQGLARDRQETYRMIAAMSQSGRADKQADTLRGEYVKRAEKVREGTGHAQNVMQMLSDPSTAKDPTKQVALIFSFGKMLDPDSVVRESEYALIANARGVFDSLQQMIPRIQSGARLSPQQLQSMQQVATNMLQGSTDRIQALDQYYADLARRRKLNVEDVLPSYKEGRRDQSSPPTPAVNANPLSPAEQAELARLRSRFGGNKP